MEQQKQLCWLAFALLFISNLQSSVLAQQVPCYFTFGDATAVNGNDNNLDTFKANYLPYGVNFPGGPTGRFSDGRTMVDVIAEKIGFKEPIPALVNVGNGSEILKGVNYASHGAILQEEIAGSKMTAISLAQQIQNHQKTVRRITNILGKKNTTSQHLNSCLYTIGVGSNDYLINYYTPGNNGSEPKRSKPSEAYAENLVDGYLFNHLTALYEAGARKIVFFGLGPLGCSPSVVTKYYATNQKCISVIDTDMHIFNSRLPIIVDRFNKNFKEAMLTYINIYDLTSAGVFPGFKVNQTPCCKVDYNGMCIPNQTQCDNPKDYFYWDGYCQTEAANIALANLAYNASDPSLAYPYNIEQLVAKTTTKKN